MKNPFLLSMVMSSAALAQTFTVAQPVGLDLSRRCETGHAQADVVVSPMTLTAPRGVRCGTGSFETRAVTTLDRECEVRMSTGESRWFRVTLEGAAMVVHLRSDLLDGLPRLMGEFTQREVSINGLPTTAQFGSLVLMDDGRYRIGRTEGRWSRRADALQFDGPIAHWGQAVVTQTGLHFTFLRGPLEYSIDYALAPKRVSQEEQRAAR